jgi:hypothetical protein
MLFCRAVISIGSDGTAAGSAGSTGGGPPLLEVLDWAARREAAKNDAGFPGLECCRTFVVVLVVVFLVAFGVLLLPDDDMMKSRRIGSCGVPVVGRVPAELLLWSAEKNEACIDRITTATPCTTTTGEDPMDQCWLRRRRSLQLGYNEN